MGNQPLETSVSLLFNGAAQIAQEDTGGNEGEEDGAGLDDDEESFWQSGRLRGTRSVGVSHVSWVAQPGHQFLQRDF